jgi:GTPase SAR1 family protein
MRTEGFVMVYDITSRSSFEEMLSQFKTQIVAATIDETIPLVLVGNKCDLEADR